MAFLQHLANGETAGALIHSDDITYQEVSLERIVQKLVHDHAEKQGMPHQLPVALRERPEQVLENGHRRLSVQFRQYVPVAGSNPHSVSDGTASLGDHGVHHDVAMQSQAYRAGIVDLTVQEQGVVAGTLGPAGQPSDLGRAGEGKIQAHNQVLHRKGERVGQQHELRLLRPRNTYQFLPLVWPGIQIRQVVSAQVKCLDIHAGKRGGGYGQRRPLLHFQTRTNNASTGTSESVFRTQRFTKQRADAGVIRLEVGRHESHRQLGWLSQLSANQLGALGQGAVQVRLFRYGRRPFHQATS